MGRISERFSALAERKECALVVFLTAGDPDLEATEALILSMAESGADLIEIGVPFSDPIAEGETIQRASERALANGTSLRSIIQLVSRIRDRVEQPLLLMGYANPLHAMGAENFAEAAAAAGVDGIIIPDLPPEAGESFYVACRDRGIDAVLLAAPTTTPARMKLLAEASRGFLYYVSLQGVTGAREFLADGIQERVQEAKQHSDIPVCVGFGISTPEHAEVVRGFADGVVVGSAIVKAIEAASSREEAVADVADLVRALKAPLR
jgi:tryptophan synthase alpha chain